MNEYSIVVDFQKGNIYTDLSILVQNDYNAYKLNFEFDKEFERALFKLKYPVENKEWVQDIVDNKLILPVLKDTGDYEYEISIYSEDGRLTGYATEKFHVRSELINTDEIVEPDDRVPVLDNLINETTQLKNETAGLKEEVENAIEETNNLNIDVSDKVNKEVNITLTKKDNTTKRVTLKDGTSLMFNWDGTRLGIKTDEDEEYVYVDLIGRTGPMGPQGEAFQVKKTYANINLMIADYDNMQINDYVMIDGNIEQEDNAKLFVKQEIEDPTYRWHYLADFSGATGIQGPTGLTPNIQIGTVTSGNTPSVSRTGTNENPILNFVLQQGPQGEIGPTGATGETGNGILNIVKLSSIDNIDTYQINMTDGTYYQFTVTNSNVTNQEFDDLKNRYESLINTLPKVTGTGTDITLNNTSEYYMKSILNPTELTQDGTPTPDNPVDVNVITGDNNINISNNLFSITDFENQFITGKILNDNGVEVSDAGSKYSKYKVSLKANTTYLIVGAWQRIYYYDSNGNFVSRSLAYNNGINTTYTPSTDEYIGFQVANTYYNNNKGNEKITTTEQNYPITLSSENLLDFDNINVKRLGTKGTVTVEKDKIIFSAASSDVYGVIIDLAGLNLKNNTTYTVSNLMDNTDSNVRPLGWRYYNGSSYTVLNNFRNYFTFTTTESGINQLLYYVGSPAAYDGTLTLYDIQLLEGIILQADLPNYAPYIANPLEYCKIGDYAGQFFKNTKDSEFYDSTLLENEWYLKKNIEKRIFDGSETNWLKDGNSYKINQSDMLTANVGNGLCNYFKNSRIDYSYTAGHIRFGWSNTYIYFYVDTENIADVNAWKDWLSTHNTKVYYQLATPTYIHISETDYPILRSQLENLYNNAKSYKGQTNITQTNDGLPFNIELSALRDLSTL
ncbi:MAG: hypothetical protein IJV15_00225 [Lachnospiraceae bacterium]|nr:hypothetical protein [Lachnospiraceae bacterium]